MQRMFTRSAVGLMVLALVAFLGPTMTRAAKNQEKAAVGQPAPTFTLQDTAGKTHRLADAKGKIVVLHFQSCTCPWDGAYQPHLNALAKKYGDMSESDKAGDKPVVVFWSINANHNESIEQIRKYKERTDMNHPVLKDEHNKVADLYGARTTPHMYVIDPEGVLRYMGGVEQVPVSVSEVGNMKTQYLAPVLDAMLAGKPLPYERTKSKGCTIKRER